MATFDFEQNWKKLHEGLQLIMNICLNIELNRKISPVEWTNLYNIVYTWCTRPEEQRKEELYRKASNFFDNIVQQQELKLREYQDGEILLREYLKTFGNFNSAAGKIRNIFAYMHRYWIPAQLSNGDIKARPLDHLALFHWREKCYAKLKPRLLTAILDLVDRERCGEQVDKTLLSSMVLSFVRLGSFDESPLAFYKAEFQDAFIQRTKEFYAKESDGFLAQNSVSEYMKRAELRINQEQLNAVHYLHPSTESDLKRAIEEVLIARHNEVLQNEFQAMLRDDKDDDMRRFFSLLSRIPNGLTSSATTMKSYLQDVGMNIVREQSTKLDTKAAVKNAIPLIQALLNLHKKYASIVKRCFSDHKLFSQAMDDAFTFFINKNVGVFSMAELLNFFVDHVLKGGEKLAEEQMDETLENIVRLFSYFNDKDVFYLAFRRSLSKRLLSRKVNEEAERSFIGKLKMCCGDVYTKKLEGMFNDIKTSDENAPAFKEYLKSSGLNITIDLTVQVLNDLNWPLSKQTDLVLSQEMAAAQKAFEDFYHKTNGKRKLTWLYNHGTVNVLHFFNDKGRLRKVEMIMSAVQACILLLFNDTDKLSFKEIQTVLNVNEEMLRFAIAPLVYEKVKILNRIVDNENNEDENNSRDVDDEDNSRQKKAEKKPTTKEVDSEEISTSDYFTLYPLKRVMKTRVIYPPGSTKTLKRESENVHEKTQQDRIIKIELALVRIMKSRNVCTQQDLIAEASRQLMPFFRPDPRVMKKRIENLMERGFMRRDENDQKRIHYVA
jgi:cullin 1